MNRLTLVPAAVIFSAMSFAATAEIYLSPWVGYTAGGSVENQDQQELDLEGSESFALSLETDIDTGRIGLFYATQSTDVENTNTSTAIHYLHFQSGVYYPIKDEFSTYLGIGLGGSYIDADWVNNELGFSASIFTGFEYKISQTLAFNTQIRWLGTVVDNDTSSICNSTSGDSSCVIKFKTDWMNQFSANLGLTVRF